MLRGFSLPVVVILLLSSGAFAAVGHAEGFSINALNLVHRVGGAGWAKSGNIVMVGHSQEAYTAGTAAIQEEKGILTQSAKAAGIGGATTVLQNASVDALQGQMIVRARPGVQAQGQCLTVGLDNIVLKAGGVGGAVGAQHFVGTQEQVQLSAGGISTNYQTVGTAQFAAVCGGPCSNVVVINSLDVKMGQSQIVTGQYTPPKPPGKP
jgi:hypothetical protein